MNGAAVEKVRAELCSTWYVRSDVASCHHGVLALRTRDIFRSFRLHLVSASIREPAC